jgi:hypothetical protein
LAAEYVAEAEDIGSKGSGGQGVISRVSVSLPKPSPTWRKKEAKEMIDPSINFRTLASQIAL